MLPIHFAPLQGYTEAPYRRVHNAVCGGIEAYYTPFIRLEHGQIRKKDLREALPEQNEGVRVVPQIIVGDATEFGVLAEKIRALGHTHININMGCPFPLQTRLGRGSGILPRREKVAEILTLAQQMHDAHGLAFSVKMRLGQEADDECLALLPLLNATALEAVTMHPRVGVDQYRGELRIDAFRRFAEGCRHPLLFNGMVERVADLHRLEAELPSLAGVMIGRGLLSRPTLAQEYASGQELEPAAVREKVLEMHARLLAHYRQAIEGGEAQLVQKMHTFWEYMEPLFGHKPIKKILKSGSLRNYMEAVGNVRNGLE